MIHKFFAYLIHEVRNGPTTWSKDDLITFLVNRYTSYMVSHTKEAK